MKIITYCIPLCLAYNFLIKEQNKIKYQGDSSLDDFEDTVGSSEVNV